MNPLGPTRGLLMKGIHPRGSEAFTLSRLESGGIETELCVGFGVTVPSLDPSHPDTEFQKVENSDGNHSSI